MIQGNETLLRYKTSLGLTNGIFKSPFVLRGERTIPKGGYHEDQVGLALSNILLDGYGNGAGAERIDRFRSETY